MIPPSHHGTFRGTNRLWLEPGKPPESSPGTLVASADRLVVRWSREGEAKEGSLVFRGPPAACRCDFTDPFHAPGGMIFHGHLAEGVLRLYGTYGVGEGAPDWGWRIEVDLGDPDRLTLRMVNVEPSGEETAAVILAGER
jgi:hypothetical protein